MSEEELQLWCEKHTRARCQVFSSEMWDKWEGRLYYATRKLQTKGIVQGLTPAEVIRLLRLRRLEQEVGEFHTRARQMERGELLMGVVPRRRRRNSLQWVY